MSDTLTIRVYNVGFGDALLITVPDRDPATGETTTRRILIDVGNAPTVASAEGGSVDFFPPVIEDILAELDGKPLDLYIMTHEHLDHVQGLHYAARRIYPDDFQDRFEVNHVWMTASAADDYYDNHPEAEKQRLAYDAMLKRITRHLQRKGLAEEPGFMELLGINNPYSTKDGVSYLKTLNPDHTAYIHRESDLEGTHPFREAAFSIWAPEEDTADYFSLLLALDLDDGPAAATAATAADAATGTATDEDPYLPPSPPPGVDAGAFLNLVDARNRGLADNMLAIDKAANDSSIVFAMEWRGWRFLFTGDAEEKSWHKMHEHGVLQPVHFLKVSHHGSHNGTPEGEAFDAILPEEAPDDAERYAMTSTWEDTYSGIPHAATDERIASRCTLYSNLQEKDALYMELGFPG
ncbi:MAG: hypothetical protein GY838_09995 [bacterium]|nr:hypothetical protein [bacterium]